MNEHVHHYLALLGASFTGVAAVVSWLPAVDIVLRIALSVSGLIVARASYRYYKSNTKKDP